MESSNPLEVLIHLMKMKDKQTLIDRFQDQAIHLVWVQWIFTDSVYITCIMLVHVDNKRSFMRITIVSPKILCSTFGQFFSKSTNTCERSSIEIDGREIKISKIHVSSLTHF